eukprot:TRINITY_DN24753_c0_g1_i1.p2 TRINITY_DN24753_c0_g1~~TRINITY_DN24753_c0_g1_i1.p2  ORF type:complete len:186 (+),score=55.57 TRINITY_DN24753_c0_g1_i1:72-629(+)
MAASDSDEEPWGNVEEVPAPRGRRSKPKQVVAAWWVDEAGVGEAAAGVGDLLALDVEVFSLHCEPHVSAALPEAGAVDWGAVKPRFVEMDEYRALAEITRTAMAATVSTPLTPPLAGFEGVYVMDGRVYCDVASRGKGRFVRIECLQGHLVSLPEGARYRLRPHIVAGPARLMRLAAGAPAAASG